MRVTKLIAGNLAVLAAILLSLNLLSFVALASHSAVRGLFLPEGSSLETRRPRASQYVPNLPNYLDKAYARLIFREFDELQTRYEPFIGWTRRPYRGVATTINEAGDRVHPAPRRDRITRTVRFFGGSTMWGSGVDDQGTIPALFNQLNPEFLVHNHGEAGLTSRQELARLINLVSQNEPIDLVIFFDGVNDVAQQCRAESEVPGHGRVAQIREALRRSRFEPSILGSLTYASYALFAEQTVRLGKIVRRRLSLELRQASGAETSAQATTHDCDEDPRKARAVAETLSNNWKIARAIVDAQGGELHAILQPNAHIGSPRIDHLRPYLEPELGRNYAAVYPRIQELMRQHDCPWIHDLTDAYDRDKTNGAFILIDDYHVTPNGNAIIARRIDEIVKSAPSRGERSSPACKRVGDDPSSY